MAELPIAKRGQTLDDLDVPVKQKVCPKCHRGRRLKMNNIWTCPWCDLKKNDTPTRISKTQDPGHEALMKDLKQPLKKADQEATQTTAPPIVAQSPDQLIVTVELKDIVRKKVDTIAKILLDSLYNSLDNIQFTTIGDAKKVIKLQEKLEKALGKEEVEEDAE